METRAPFPKCPQPLQAASAAGKRPLLTSLEALPVLPGDHPVGGRVAGHRAVVPGVHQTVASLAGVVPATREHMGGQGGQSWAHTAQRESAPGSRHRSSLFGSSATNTRPLGEQQCLHRAQAAQASLPYHPSKSPGMGSGSELEQQQWAAPSSHHFSFLLMKHRSSPPGISCSPRGFFLP